MPATPPRLTDRHTEQTRQWMVEAAVDLMEADPEAPLVNALIAQRAGVSERTVYRHFPTRDSLLDAVGLCVARRLAVPELPDSLDALVEYPARLYGCFETHSNLTRAALKPDIFVRMRDGQAARRWTAIQSLLDRSHPELEAEERRMATAHIRYLLAATTWRYYRDNFGFTAEETVHSVQIALRHILAGLAGRRTG